VKSILENEKFNTEMETSDWRYSASIVGLIKYFNYLTDNGYETKSNLYEIEDDVIRYNQEAITEERYLRFVEYYFEEYMHHKIIDKILSGNEISEEQIKVINEKIKANEIMKKVFGKSTFTFEKKEEIMAKIEQNRLNLIKETYRRGKSLYAKFSNPNKLLIEKDDVCRMLNYNVDTGRKTKAISYNWDFNTFNYEDTLEFDFIPFAFTKSQEAFFINNNYSIKQLFNTNNLIFDSKNPRSTLFSEIRNSADFIDFDVEVIIKDRETEYFETLFIRKYAIKILSSIEDYKAIKFNYRINDKYFIDYEKEVTDCILNNIKLDKLIETLLKPRKDTEKYKYPNFKYNISSLIKINTLIYGGDKMDKQMKSAYGSAKKVIERIPGNKVESYKQKLISAITFKDYDRFCEILLSLSSYSDVVFDFAYDLFKDFEENKNIAYTFVNALNIEKKNNEVGKHE
jgi:CRISPR-associated protein Cst1